MEITDELYDILGAIYGGDRVLEMIKIIDEERKLTGKMPTKLPKAFIWDIQALKKRPPVAEFESKYGEVFQINMT